MKRQTVRRWAAVCQVVPALVWQVTAAEGASLDTRGEVSLGVRAYTSVRIQSEQTDGFIDYDPRKEGAQIKRSLTFPVSSAGHLRQSRFFVEAELDHKLGRLVRDGFGPLELLNDLPFKVRNLKYHLVYRGEVEGIYDYGPRELRTADQFRDRELVPCLNEGRSTENCPDIAGKRKDLRRIGSQRHRLFEAFVEGDIGRLFFRFGRQILAWGETDAFRLLDNINPLDSSFGGFLVPLDERRVPLDMLRLNYYVGSLGPLYETYIEAYAAVDDAVGYAPGNPNGSAWALPNLGHPSTTTERIMLSPRRNLTDARGGFQVKFNAPMPWIGDATFGVAHYYTYLDRPAVQTFVNRDTDGSAIGDRTFFPAPLESGPGVGFMTLAVLTAPRVQVTGATSTFAFPSRLARQLGLSGEPIIRAEVAYFRGQQRHSQSQLDPFVYHAGGRCRTPTELDPDGPGFEDGELCTGGRNTGDSWNFVVGVDLNQWVRFLNPRQTFFLSTQFFYKHLRGAAKRAPIFLPGEEQVGPGQLQTPGGEVLPAPELQQRATSLPTSSRATQSILINHPADQYLQTLLIGTSYYSGQIVPSLSVFYDWSGALVAVPQVRFSRDPFRFIVSYSYLNASRLKGASGTSLLRDRDNVLFQVEYVL